jgi:hypothetical protein
MGMPKMDNPLKKEIDFKSLLKKKPGGGSPLSFSKKKPINHAEEVAKFSPGLPIVNLMPDAVLEEYAANDLKAKFIKIGLGIIAGFAIIWAISFILGGINQKKIDTISDETSNISQELRSLTPFATYRTEVQAKRTALATQMAQEIDPGKINSSFSKIASDAGFTVSSLSVSVSGTSASSTGGAPAAAGGTCVNPDPFNSVSGIGCLTFSLTPTGGANIAALYAGLNKADSGFVNAYIPKAVLTAGTGTGANTIDGSASFNDSFFTKAYATYNNPIDTVLPKVNQ